MSRRTGKTLASPTSLRSAVDALEERFVAWAKTRPDIRAAIVVGSRARIDHPADEWADLDVAIATDRASRYLTRHSWLGALGSPAAWYLDPSGVVLHVLFEDGADAGFAYLPAGTFRRALRFLPLFNRFPALFHLLPGGLGLRMRADVDAAADYYRRGCRVLIDKDGLAKRFLALFPASAQSWPVPSKAEFEEAVSRFWFGAAWTAKHLRRGELWWARNSADGHLKAFLLQILEWNAHARHGWDYETWQDGRFLEEWADPEVLARLRDAFARYDEDDLWRGLLATMDLFRDLARDTAKRLGLDYPVDADAYVTRLVVELEAGRKVGQK